MKTEHLLVGLAAFAFMIPSTLAVVGGPEPGEGEMAITSSGSSASASQAVGPNGTEWKAEVSMVNRTGNVSEDRIEDISYGEDNYSVEFTGYITAPTPCHTISHEVEESEDGYVMQIETVKEQDNRTACLQVLTMIEYDAEFSTDEAFELKVRHGNETVDTLYHPGIAPDAPVQNRGPIASLVQWVRGLLGMEQTKVKTAQESTSMELESSEGDIVFEER